jgi:hypothetical protein
VGQRADLEVMEKRKISCPYRESNTDSSVVHWIKFLSQLMRQFAHTLNLKESELLFQYILAICFGGVLREITRYFQRNSFPYRNTRHRDSLLSLPYITELQATKPRKMAIRSLITYPAVLLMD